MAEQRILPEELLAVEARIVSEPPPNPEIAELQERMRALIGRDEQKRAQESFEASIPGPLGAFVRAGK